MQVTIVLAATTGRAPHLAGAVAAALAQSHHPLDVLVIAHGAADPADGSGLPGALDAFAGDPRLRWLRLPAREESAARNLGLLLARGEAVSFHGVDDIPAHDKIAAQVAALADGADAAFGGHCAISAEGEERLVEEWGPGVSAGAALYRREALAGVGGFAPGRGADALRRRIEAAGGRIRFLPRPLLTRFERPLRPEARTMEARAMEARAVDLVQGAAARGRRLTGPRALRIAAARIRLRGEAKPGYV